jgi:hypothetical protein
VPRFLRHSTKEFDYLDLVRPPVANPLPSQIEELIRDELFTPGAAPLPLPLTPRISGGNSEFPDVDSGLQARRPV